MPTPEVVQQLFLDFVQQILQEGHDAPVTLTWAS